MAYAQLTQAKAHQVERNVKKRQRIKINKRTLRQKKQEAEQAPIKINQQDKQDR